MSTEPTNDPRPASASSGELHGPTRETLERELDRCGRISAARRDRLVVQSARTHEAETVASILRAALRKIARDMRNGQHGGAALEIAEQALNDDRVARGHEAV